MDVNLTAGVFNELFPKLPLNERRVIDITIQLYLDTPWKIDKEYLRQADADIYMNRERLIRESGIDRETLASTTRLGQLIETYYDSTFKQIPSPTVLNPDNTKYPFGKDHPRFKQLQKFAEEKPELKAILDARLAVSSNQEATRIRRILNSLPGEEDHFIGAALNTYGAITLRWSGTNRLNFQNQIVGSPIRRSMGTQDFETVIAHDYVSVEPRVLAYITGCQKLIDAYRNNVDLYSEFASIIYGFPVTKKTHPTERYVGKTCIIGLGYGMGATRLQAALAEGKRGPSLNFGLDECQRMVRLYRTTYPEIPTFWADVENALTVAATKTEDTTQCWGLPNNSGIRFTPRHILLPNDCHIHYPQLTIGTAKTLTDGDADKIGKLIYNTRHSKTSTWGGKITENICQGISRGITAEHVVKISEWLDENPVGMLALLVHDEIVSIVRQDGAREYVEAVDRIMTTNPSWASEDLILEVEGSYGPNYGSLEEITHERPISFI